MTTYSMEIILSNFFNFRTNIIVPNVSWGFFNYELDLLVITPAGYGYEIEIKRSKSDLLADRKKRHLHDSKYIRKLYYAINNKIPVEFAIQNIPDRAGLLLVDKRVEIIRKPILQNSKKFDDIEKLKIAHLGCMRIWGLKKKFGQED